MKRNEQILVCRRSHVKSSHVESREGMKVVLASSTKVEMDEYGFCYAVGWLVGWAIHCVIQKGFFCTPIHYYFLHYSSMMWAFNWRNWSE